jgi:sugar phosphate isomerase/epimerase
MSCLIGYTGFIGLNLLKYVKFDYLYNSKNINDIKNKNFDIIYFCGLPAEKWKINNEPDKDLENINNIITLLNTVKTHKFILISTIDVYENQDIQHNENMDCLFKTNNHYGKHRYLFEKYVIDTFKNNHILRLPALFGDGLKKNVLYDLLNNNQVHKISVNTWFQWYNVNDIYKDINYVIENDIKIINLFSEPVETMKILKMFQYDYSNNPNNYLKYQTVSIYGFHKTENEILGEIQHYILSYKKTNINLSVSNICVNNILFEQFYGLLKLHGFKNIEIAPTKYMTWDDFNDENINKIKNELDNFDVKISSFQSITFNAGNMNIFEETTHLTFLSHLRKIIKVSKEQNIKKIVFGCPKNRYLKNENEFYVLDKLKCYDIQENMAVQFFQIVGDICKLNDVVLCIENNSKLYNCNFLNTISDVGNFVLKVNHSNIKMMVDIGNCIMENDDLNDIYKYVNIIEHIHISCEKMNSFTNIHDYHKNFVEILKHIQYNKYITLEFLNNEDDILKLNESLCNFKSLI